MKKNLKIYYCFLVYFLVYVSANGQDKYDDIKIEFETGAYLSTSGNNPFWLRTNQYGEVPLEAQGLYAKAGIKKEYVPLIYRKGGKGKFAYGYGAQAVYNTSSKQVVLSELYGKVRFRAFELYAGRRKEIVGLADSTLSSGSYIWSGNALPTPKVQLAIINFAPILKNGLIAIKGNYAHGWFGSTDSLKSYYLHQKSFYFRVGKPNWRFKSFAGFNHHVQWGGRPAVPYIQGYTNALITTYGNDLHAYSFVVTGKYLSEVGYYPGTSDISGEGGNRVGNHLGTVDFAFQYEAPDSRIFLYRQSIYDDGSLFLLSNISDGLSGISFTRTKATTGILKVVLEYLDTRSQGGPDIKGFQAELVGELRGYDNYFNNSIYVDGWTYKGQTIGTPFLMPLRLSTNLAQNKDLVKRDPNFIVNNRVHVFYIGMQSKFKQFSLTTRFSFSQNLGNYYFPIHLNQASLLQQVSFPVNQYIVNASIAYDTGGLLEKNLGTNFSIKRSF